MVPEMLGTVLTAFSTQPGISPATGQLGREPAVDKRLLVPKWADEIDQRLGHEVALYRMTRKFGDPE